jgi:DNA-binding GntR family transcriptional regulator
MFHCCLAMLWAATGETALASVPTTLRIRRALEDAIVQGRYLPGTRLDPEALEQEFDCSRTPIREAFQQLEASGLVRVMPKRGTFVSQWTPAELAERFEVMAEVEASCGRLAARRINDAELDAFRQVMTTAAAWPRRARSRPITPAIRISTTASIVPPTMPF